jgi:1-deoxy-D-xylulose-5-phosphate synthase
LQDLPVVFALDRGGLVGADGPTHHGLADIAYLRLWPNLVVCAPADAAELPECLRFALRQPGPVAFRFPRDEAACPAGPTTPFELGKAVSLRTGPDAVLVAYGALVTEALRAADLLAERGMWVGVLNARFVKPLDEAALSRALAEHPLLVTVEDHFLSGGFGSAVLEFAAELSGPQARIVRLGVPDRFVEHASRRRQLEEVGLSAASIADRVCREITGRCLSRSYSCSPIQPAKAGKRSPHAYLAGQSAQLLRRGRHGDRMLGAGPGAAGAADLRLPRNRP